LQACVPKKDPRHVNELSRAVQNLSNINAALARSYIGRR
jgi:hypothetical protein